MTQPNLYEQLKILLEELQRIEIERAKVTQKIHEITLSILCDTQSKNSEEEEVFSIKELAQFLGVSEQFMYKNSRRIPHILLGSRPMYIKSEVIAYLKKHQIKPIQEKPRGRPPRFQIPKGPVE
jgi:hypothetical protein